MYMHAAPYACSIELLVCSLLDLSKVAVACKISSPLYIYSSI